MLFFLRKEVLTMDLKKTGALIAQLRRKKNLTQKELATQLGVTDKAISRWMCRSLIILPMLWMCRLQRLSMVNAVILRMPPTKVTRLYYPPWGMQEVCCGH